MKSKHEIQKEELLIEKLTLLQRYKLLKKSCKRNEKNIIC